MSNNFHNKLFINDNSGPAFSSESDLTTKIEIGIKRVNKDTQIPKYNMDGDSGFDIRSMETVIIEPGETKTIPTGIALELYKGLELQVRPRSGISSKTKIRVCLGTGDSIYRGDYKVTIDNIAHPKYYLNKLNDTIDVVKTNMVLNLKGEYEEIDHYVPEGSVIIHKGDRIAQGVICFVVKGIFVEKDELSETERGDNGFGSSGV